RTQSQADLIQQLRQKVLEYDYLAGRLERSQGEWPGEPADAFDLAPFQRAAGAALGEKWAALDYYLSEKTLSLALCTAAGCQIWQREIPASVRLALRLCHQARRQPPHLTPADLTALGEWLLPADLVASLSPTTVVLIAPHRQLHAVPWAALRWPGQTTYLVESCLPLVTPSLHSWRLLWRREEGRPPEPDRPLPPRGLALGVASFGRRHTPLPLVTEEVAAIRAYLDPASTVLLDSAATWDSLRSLAGEEGLARFALWHVASHAYHDPLTGRLSGFALHDRDVWLDEVWQLAPLPGLVVLSACQGIQSLIYEGDEPVSLTATCLAAGARTVMGSLWPVLDVETAALMVEFYKQLSQGQRPAASLALALRQAIAQGLDVRQWAGFLCLGLP
ncbi:MAG: CHAT domain-containing protein, partial [Chloroflexota bacterium]